MPIDPIKIPQNVYIEDRIVGPLTLKQVIIAAIGGGFSYGIYSMLAQAYGALSLPITIVVWIPAALSLLFAFIKINDLSMLQICLLMLERINKPGIRTWAPRRGITINIRTQATPAPTAPTAAAPVGTPQNRVDELSAILDRTATEESDGRSMLRPDGSPSEEAILRPDEAATPQPSSQDQEELSTNDDEFDTDSVTMATMPPRPVDPSRISVNPLDRNADTIAASVTASRS